MSEKTKSDGLICKRCQKREAVCIWDLEDEFYKMHLCGECCSELSKEYRKSKIAAVVHCRVCVLKHLKKFSLATFFFAMLLVVYYLRDAEIDFSLLWDAQNIFSYIIFLLIGSTFSTVITLDRGEGFVYKISVFLAEVALAIVSICLTFSLDFSINNPINIAIITVLFLIVICSFILFLFYAKVKRGGKVTEHVALSVFIFGAVLNIIAVALIAVKK